MASIARWLPQGAWTEIATTAFDGLAAGSYAPGGTIYDNSSSSGAGLLDTDFLVAIQVTTSGTSGSPAYIPLYALPLHEDATTYGDGTAAGTVSPGSTYFVGNIMVTQSTTGLVKGVLSIGYLLPTKYQFGIGNSFANALASAPATASGLWIAPNAINLNG